MTQPLGALRPVYVVGVGMVPFTKPGASESYNTMGAKAARLALDDAGVDYALVQQAYVGYVYGDSTAGQAAIYGLGLPAFVLVKTLTPGFFARGDTATPVKVGIGVVALNLVLNENLPVDGIYDADQDWLPVDLDSDAMHAAAQHLVGKHDFTTFRAAQCQASSPVKTLDRMDVARYGELLSVTGGRERLLHDMASRPDAPADPQERAALAALLLLGLPRLASAQGGWPQRPITLVVPFVVQLLSTIGTV